ncbi:MULTISPECIES: contact-dependent growth inhibition system immunity protein [Klebsiella/Raoultella group]|uniref:contact-dependent growth inhibition system immunity protein n=1 Tax=Klebsiella/Raoultella group TaxID=2890311 RepID=UPI001D190180|nr:contact-dependent growth inhibition system immunity protein [Klebsiella electrica]WIO45417.1 contact-dependent growth inhibition system immunity protein [Klebsiella electrica]
METQSGQGRTSADPLFPPHLLLPEADDECAGQTILQALYNSWTLNKFEDRVAFFDLEKGKEKYAAWIARLMDRYGYKTKSALFKDMKHCIIHCVNGVITIRPTRHEKLEGWGGTKGDSIEDVILSTDNSPAEIGAGLRLALSRCKG